MKIILIIVAIIQSALLLCADGQYWPTLRAARESDSFSPTNNLNFSKQYLDGKAIYCLKGRNSNFGETYRNVSDSFAIAKSILHWMHRYYWSLYRLYVRQNGLRDCTWDVNFVNGTHRGNCNVINYYSGSLVIYQCPNSTSKDQYHLIARAIGYTLGLAEIEEGESIMAKTRINDDIIISPGDVKALLLIQEQTALFSSPEVQKQSVESTVAHYTPSYTVKKSVTTTSPMSTSRQMIRFPVYIMDNNRAKFLYWSANGISETGDGEKPSSAEIFASVSKIEKERAIQVEPIRFPVYIMDNNSAKFQYWISEKGIVENGDGEKPSSEEIFSKTVQQNHQLTKPESDTLMVTSSKPAHSRKQDLIPVASALVEHLINTPTVTIGLVMDNTEEEEVVASSSEMTNGFEIMSTIGTTPASVGDVMLEDFGLATWDNASFKTQVVVLGICGIIAVFIYGLLFMLIKIIYKGYTRVDVA